MAEEEIKELAREYIDSCTKRAGGEEVGDFWLGYLDWVYYQSGDIEMRFSDTEIKEEK